MTIENKINHEQFCVYTNCTGVMNTSDFDDYLSRIWTISSNFGYNELFDTTQADWSEFDFKYLINVAKMASQLTAIDPCSKLAWVVLEGEAKQQIDFYIATKASITKESRQLEAFYNHDDALNWLGVI